MFFITSPSRHALEKAGHLLGVRGLRAGGAGIVAICGLLTACGLLTSCANPASFGIEADAQAFQQNPAKVNNQIDILWVVDNSGSMSPFQKNLVDNFSNFIADFQQKSFDFQIAVTTSDSYLATPRYRNEPDLARFRDGLESNVTGIPVITSSTPNLLDVFVKNATVGSKGSGDERAFQSLFAALKSPLNSGFLRSGSFLAIVILSDEDDFTDFSRPEASYSQPDGIKDHDYKNPGLAPVNEVVQQLDALTGSTAADRRYNVSAITITSEACRAEHAKTFAGALIGQRYIDLAQKTNGELGSICDASFARSLDFIQRRIVELSTQFKLNRKPNPDSIRVVINGTLVPRDPLNGWSYNADTNSILFHGTGVPPAGTDIRIAFDPIELK